MSVPVIRVFVFPVGRVDVAGHSLVHTWALTDAGKWVGGGVSHDEARALEYCAQAVRSKAVGLFGVDRAYEIIQTAADDERLRPPLETALSRQP